MEYTPAKTAAGHVRTHDAPVEQSVIDASGAAYAFRVVPTPYWPRIISGTVRYMLNGPDEDKRFIALTDANGTMHYGTDDDLLDMTGICGTDGGEIARGIAKGIEHARNLLKETSPPWRDND